jgi:hypothetical protein
MHQATLSLQAPRGENSGSLPFFSLLLDFDVSFFARPKDACCLPTLRAVGGAMGGFRCRLGWCWVLALFLKLLRHTVVSF